MLAVLSSASPQLLPLPADTQSLSTVPLFISPKNALTCAISPSFEHTFAFTQTNTLSLGQKIPLYGLLLLLSLPPPAPGAGAGSRLSAQTVMHSVKQ